MWDVERLGDLSAMRGDICGISLKAMIYTYGEDIAWEIFDFMVFLQESFKQKEKTGRIWATRKRDRFTQTTL